VLPGPHVPGVSEMPAENYYPGLPPLLTPYAVLRSRQPSASHTSFGIARAAIRMTR
jgi:hypothetical protein